MFGVMDLNKGYCWNAEDLTMHEITNGYNPRPVTIEDFVHKRPWTSWVIVPKDYINIWKSGHKCQHDGCFKDGSVECHVPGFEDVAFAGRSYDATRIKVIEHLCCDHAFESGYCICCGEFWGGIESFDFDNPSHLCEHCLEQAKDEIGEDDDINGEDFGFGDDNV